MNIYERWKKAVVHLETATDSSSPYESWAELAERHRQRVKGDISVDEYLQHEKDLSSGHRDLRYTGTAVFLEDDGRRYLLTARHVLYDEAGAKFLGEYKKRLTEEMTNRLDERFGPELDQQSWRRSHEEEEAERLQAWLCDQIVPIVFRVVSLDELEQARQQPGAITTNGSYRKETQHLMSLDAGPGDTKAYSFSDVVQDLAIISLDHWDREGFQDRKFGDGLIAAGYRPITMGDISDEPSGEGEELFTVGYPSDVSLSENLDLSEPGLSAWASENVSLPIFAFGRVAMLHPSLDYFWSDISVYPGNSGGPVIENNKLVGIIRAQATTAFRADADGSRDDTHDAPVIGRVRIPFGKITKAKYIRGLLEQQIRRDKNYQAFHDPRRFHDPEANH